MKKLAAKRWAAMPVETLEKRQLLSGTPQDAVLANQLVSGISPANNSYAYGTPTVTWAGINGTTDFNASDCSTFQTMLLEQAYGFTSSQFSSWTGSTLPQSQDLYTAALDDKGFTGFSQVADLQVGDEIFVKYIQSDSSGDTGHCMMVDALPTVDAAYTTATQKAYDLTIIDCTADPHSNDTRTNGESGVGRGTIRIYTDLSGNLTAYSWGLSSQSVVETPSVRPAIFAKPPPTSSNSFLAAGSQATWNSSNDSLVITGPASIVTDPGSSQQPVVTISGSGSQLLLMPGNTSVVHLASLTLSGGGTATVNDPNTGNVLIDVAANIGNGIVSVDSTSKFDLGSNDMIVHGGSLSAITSLIAQGYHNGKWTGNGITSSSAAGDTTHLTALGAILNTNGSTAIYPSFDGVLSTTADVLVRHTYIGDANLDGKVDASDYSLLDNGYLHQATLSGWFNGDFNYDGVVNGSDYTLMDNTFNTQRAALVFSPSSQLADVSAKPVVTATALPGYISPTSPDDLLKKKKSAAINSVAKSIISVLY